VEDLNKIKDRIAKLLAMADDTSSPEEAAIAASRARKLMGKYQLEAWECSKEIEEAFATKRATRAYAAIPEYINWLATAVAEFDDCQSVMFYDHMTYKMDSKRNQNEGRRPKSVGRGLEFRGYESDVNMAVAMFDKLHEAMNRQCKSYLAPFGYSKYPVKEGTAFKASFCGVIGSRLRDMTTERDELTMTSSSTALVLIKKAAVDEKFGEVKYSNGKYQVDESDWSARHAGDAGYRAGQRQQIMEEIQ
jgi:hypothetical protein